MIPGPGLVEAFHVAVTTIANPLNLALIGLGTVLGLIMGVLPGLGGVVALALLIPITYSFDPLIAFMLLAAALGGSNFGGSITAILLNVPGTPPNAATVLDGYPMAQQGRAAEAIAASATASMFGALFGIAVLLASVPFILPLSLLFGPPEIFWLAIWGLSVIVLVSHGSVLSSLISALLGIVFTMHGLNTMTTTLRWTYGIRWIEQGFDLIPMLIGLFAVGEMLVLAAQDTSISNEAISVGKQAIGDIRAGVASIYTHRWLFLRSSLIGCVIGTIPGVGGTVANFISYFSAVQTSDNSDRFGDGDIRGVIASEASNDAKDGGSLLPTLALGIPGSAATAVLIGAFVLHGISPGPLFIRNHLDIVAIVITSLVVANVLSSGIGLLTTNHLVKITRVDTNTVIPVVVALSFLAQYMVSHNMFDLFVVSGFGLLGFVMAKVGMSRIPMILGIVLAPILEENFFRAHQISNGEYSIFYDSFTSIFLIGVILVSIFLTYRGALQNLVPMSDINE